MLLSLSITASPSEAAQTVQHPHAEWTRNASIYEVNIRQYTPEGTISAFEKQLPRLKKMGAKILWIMPVQPIGKLNRKGSVGSYYSTAAPMLCPTEIANKAAVQTVSRKA